VDARRSPYGATIMEHFRRPRNHGPLAAPDVTREGVNPLCGDRIRIELALRGSRISEAGFTANACAISVAAASLLTERVRGMTAADVAAITDEDVLESLGGDVPPARHACAMLPRTTLLAALAEAGAAQGKRAGRGTPG
jgi:nitrogen fixation NifU-like protein